mmetsp:Transcript_4092/g.11870  ORF Transcript_4092/g.11870 Transcript_4092/m.11870 type:complete len:218 (-) Transcript_4092:324-977(-)
MLTSDYQIAYVTYLPPPPHRLVPSCRLAKKAAAGGDRKRKAKAPAKKPVGAGARAGTRKVQRLRVSSSDEEAVASGEDSEPLEAGGAKSGSDSDNSHSSVEEVLPVSRRMAARIPDTAPAQGSPSPQTTEQPKQLTSSSRPVKKQLTQKTRAANGVVPSGAVANTRAPAGTVTKTRAPAKRVAAAAPPPAKRAAAVRQKATVGGRGRQKTAKQQAKQ